MKDTPPEGDRAEDFPKEIPSLLGSGAALARAGSCAACLSTKSTFCTASPFGPANSDRIAPAPSTDA